MADTRADRAIARRAEGQKALDARVAEMRAARDAAKNAGLPVFVGDYSPRDGYAPLHDVETAMRVGVVSGRNAEHVAERVGEIVAERVRIAELNAEREAATADTAKANNQAIRDAALAALKPAKPAKPAGPADTEAKEG